MGGGAVPPAVELPWLLPQELLCLADWLGLGGAARVETTGGGVGGGGCHPGEHAKAKAASPRGVGWWSGSHSLSAKGSVSARGGAQAAKVGRDHSPWLPKWNLNGFSKVRLLDIICFGS